MKLYLLTLACLTPIALIGEEGRKGSRTQTTHEARASHNGRASQMTLAMQSSQSESQAAAETKASQKSGSSKSASGDRAAAARGEKKPANASAPASPTRSVSNAAEKKALEFVGEHQPKLQKLLTFLKANQPTEYGRAIREMVRTQTRLENLADRDESLYRVELALWNTRSRLRLLAAEMTVAAEEKRERLQTQLERLVKQEIKQELQKMQMQRDRIAKQLAQIDRQIEEHKSAEHPAEALKVWTNRIQKQKKAAKE